MNKSPYVALASLIIGLSCQLPGVAADVTVSAADWQKQSLKGITSIRYGIIDYSKYGFADDVKTALGGLKVKTKLVENLKADADTPLSVTEARVKVVAQDREKDQCWVGLSVEQRCQLKRTPSINLDSETYKVGKLCPRTQVKAAAKEICAEFVKDWPAKP